MQLDHPNVTTSLARLEYLEDHRRFVQNALEMALSLGDFQEEIRNQLSFRDLLCEAEKRIRRIMGFETGAFYLVKEGSSDLEPALCVPVDRGAFMDEKLDFMIDQGLVAWAIRERRGLTVPSRDRTTRIFLHVIATSVRIRGLFVGVFPKDHSHAPDASLDLLSIILRNTANAMESVEYNSIIREQRRVLEEKVKEKTLEALNYERRLQRAQKMEALGALAGGIAHDLNNVLTGIVSYPDLVLMQLPGDSPLRGSISAIKESGKKAAAIVQDLLTLARRGVANVTVFNLNQVIRNYLTCSEHLKLQSYHPGLKVETSLDDDLLNMKGSSLHIYKTIMNMVSNAAEAMPEGGTLRITTENIYIDTPVKGYDEIVEGDYVVFTVSDNGVGISPEDKERIFEPFYTKKVMGRSGTGLGMSVVWGTVKDHKGFLDLRSEVGRGTECSLYFPAVREECSPRTKETEIAQYLGNGESILVVDDVEDQREITHMLLTNLGYSVTTAASGEEGVEILGKQPFDLVVLDMIMDPGIDGLETYKRMVDIRPGQKAIIVSGFSETERVKETQKLGAGRYIRKPYTISILGVAVRSELES